MKSPARTVLRKTNEALYAVSHFEIDRLAIVRREEGAREVLFYQYPVQKLYQLFIEAMDIPGFESVASIPTKIVIGNAK